MFFTHKARFLSIFIILAMLFSFTNISPAGASSSPKTAMVRTQLQDSSAVPMLTAALVSQTFDYTGGVQTWTVPAGVTQVTLDVFGAKAGDESAIGGNGGRATVAIAVTPGETLTIVVGGMSQSPFLGGSPNGGFNGGGNGGAPFDLPAAYSGSGGGGASDVRIGGTDLAHRVIVAGGGGGAAAVFGPDGPSYGGAGGGLNGSTGNTAYIPYAANGGAGGNQTGSTGSGQAGVGSNAAPSTSTIFNGVGAGGGGGGYYGGAAGSPGTGGGGGSGFGPAGTLFATGVNGGNGKVTISFAINCAAGSYDNGTTCVNADPGYYVASTGATSQTPCEIGFYQPNSGSTSCIPADPGKYAPTTGMIVATNCALGSYQPNAGSSSCILASPGYFVDTISAVAQTLCPVGYTSLAGAVFCEPIDNLSPTASPSQSPAANIAGWNNSDVTVTWNWSDNVGGSGIYYTNCASSNTSSGEGSSILLSATCKDLAGNTGTASFNVNIDKTNPTINANATKADNTPYLAGTWTNQSVTVTYVCNDNGGSGIAAGACPADAVFSSDGITALVGGTTTDNAGNGASTSFGPINIDKTGLVTSAGGPYAGSEGTSIVLNNASAVKTLNPVPVTVTWSVDSALCTFSNVNALKPSLTCKDNGSFTAKLTATDGLNTVSSNAAVTVSNVTPTLSAIAITNALAPINTSINASAIFTDPGSMDTHTASWNWDDGSPSSAGTIVENNGSGTASASHKYTLPGVYVPKLTVTDKDGAVSSQAIYEFLVIYDPSAGFVTGGSTIKVLGAYLANPTATYSGKLGFNSKYKKDGSLESETEFELTGIKFHFHSNNAAWLIVNGYKAEYQGTGTVEGSNHLYGFTVTVIDGQAIGGGGTDKIRLSIWDITNGNTFVYDTQPGSPVTADPSNPIVNGNLMIHK
jgi:hypothetical protein